MAVTGTNITLVLRAEKGSILEEDELDGNQSALKNAIENHSHDEFSAEPGADGVGVSSVAINGSGNLIITLTDASVHDLGRVVGIDGDDGISITGVAINGSNHLIVTLSTGATIDAGALPSGGGTGDMLASVYDPDADGKISYNDLENKPTLGTAAAADADDFAAADTTAAALSAMAEEIEALSTPAGGMTNPMTAAGDIIIGGTSGAPTRLAKGSDGQLLGYVGGTVAPVNAPTGGAAVQQATVTLSQNASINITATTVIGVYESIDNVSIVPVMTSNTTPSGIATSSAIWSASNDTYKAFDGNDSTYFSPLVIGQDFLAYQFPGALNITSYSIKGTDLTYSPSSWTLEGSNDGINWTILHTVTNNTSYVSGYIFTVSSPGLYTNYKLNMSASRNPAGGPNVYTLEFYAGVFNLLTKTDYNVSRGTANGIQTHTITRLKTGTASMVIDYI